ncbi:hypothetical protein M501DRAFT_1015770 [Patellaria atrata CBS 101060]|uniref:DUF7514 domain-containing protein n=1 Tax=Patellaria atrata CBS 101060 TaxID=1346257 RepID=A0A9P4SDC3_9PEZI|nr:hypothetical protein M501DRAFT_1015770 [Patellaria atrata CBS 101060]
MAHEGYHSPPEGDNTNLPGAYPQYDFPDARTYQSPASQYYPANNVYSTEKRPRSRAASSVRSDTSQQQAQPIYDAVNTAFNKSDAASTIDPAIIAQISEQVKRQVLDSLRGSSVSQSGPTQTKAPSNEPHSPQLSNASTSTIPPRNVYTPPSPTRHEFASATPLSPERPAHTSQFLHSRDNESTPTGRNMDNSNTSPTSKAKNASSEPSYKRPSPPPTRKYMSDQEMTTLEKIWQPLFDEDGQPTRRLGQFLRGLAIHIIDDYEPKKSLVIPPQKMLKFYEDAKLQDETYPWSTIFSRLPYATVSKIYRDLKCEHHLIQEGPRDVPQIPALTPTGFETWMTILIQSYPQDEYERLAHAVMHMPISNADDSKERFPKELSRRLFPKQASLQARQICDSALSVDGTIPLPKPSSVPPPPPTQPPPVTLERERKPYSGSHDSAVETDDEDHPCAVTIERERKPYSAQPGGGKVYGDDPRDTIDPSYYEDKSRLPTRNDTNPTRHHRSKSTATQDGYPPSTGGVYAPGQGPEHHRTGSMLNGRRQRSPSFGNGAPYTRSEANVADIPSTYYASGLHSEPLDEETRRQSQKVAEAKRAEWMRRQAEEEASRSGSYVPPRSVYNDDQYHRGSTGGHNGYGNSGGYSGYPPPPARY